MSVDEKLHEVLNFIDFYAKYNDPERVLALLEVFTEYKKLVRIPTNPATYSEIGKSL